MSKSGSGFSIEPNGKHAVTLALDSPAPKQAITDLASRELQKSKSIF